MSLLVNCYKSSAPVSAVLVYFVVTASQRIVEACHNYAAGYYRLDPSHPLCAGYHIADVTTAITVRKRARIEWGIWK